jgi:type 1 fimbria pilin
MSPPRASVALVASLLVIAGAGCRPKFAPHGELTLSGEPFRPTACRVLVGATGVELADAAGSRLELVLPPQTLDAFRDVKGTPRAQLTRPSGARVDLGACGALTLTGEGYHGEGRRAASGHLVLACDGGAGTLDFEGCF